MNERNINCQISEALGKSGFLLARGDVGRVAHEVKKRKTRGNPITKREIVTAARMLGIKRLRKQHPGHLLNLTEKFGQYAVYELRDRLVEFVLDIARGDELTGRVLSVLAHEAINGTRRIVAWSPSEDGEQGARTGCVVDTGQPYEFDDYEVVSDFLAEIAPDMTGVVIDEGGAPPDLLGCVACNEWDKAVVAVTFQHMACAATPPPWEQCQTDRLFSAIRSDEGNMLDFAEQHVLVSVNDMLGASDHSILERLGDRPFATTIAKYDQGVINA